MARHPNWCQSGSPDVNRCIAPENRTAAAADRRFPPKRRSCLTKNGRRTRRRSSMSEKACALAPGRSPGTSASNLGGSPSEFVLQQSISGGPPLAVDARGSRTYGPFRGRRPTRPICLAVCLLSIPGWPVVAIYENASRLARSSSS